MPRAASQHGGYSAIEVLFATTMMVVVMGMAVPQMLASVDDTRTVGAARYLAGRFQHARMEAIGRSAVVSVRFSADVGGYAFAVYVDGNGNGVLAADIQRGVDWLEARPERLSDSFQGVSIGVLPGVPPVDSDSAAPNGDPLKLGASNAVSFSPQGTSSSGSVYLLGRGRAQFVIRIFGETGKTRLLRYDAAVRQWKPL